MRRAQLRVAAKLLSRYRFSTRRARREWSSRDYIWRRRAECIGLLALGWRKMVSYVLSLSVCKNSIGMADRERISLVLLWTFWGFRNCIHSFSFLGIAIWLIYSTTLTRNWITEPRLLFPFAKTSLSIAMWQEKTPEMLYTFLLDRLYIGLAPLDRHTMFLCLWRETGLLIQCLII